MDEGWVGRGKLRWRGEIKRLGEAACRLQKRTGEGVEEGSVRVGVSVVA